MAEWRDCQIKTNSFGNNEIILFNNAIIFYHLQSMILLQAIGLIGYLFGKLKYHCSLHML